MPEPAAIIQHAGAPTPPALVYLARDECLNLHWFMSLANARQTIETWRTDYNGVRPHSALAHLTPTAVAEHYGRTKGLAV